MTQGSACQPAQERRRLRRPPGGLAGDLGLAAFDPPPPVGRLLRGSEWGRAATMCARSMAKGVPGSNEKGRWRVRPRGRLSGI